MTCIFKQSTIQSLTLSEIVTFTSFNALIPEYYLTTSLSLPLRVVHLCGISRPLYCYHSIQLKIFWTFKNRQTSKQKFMSYHKSLQFICTLTYAFMTKQFLKVSSILVSIFLIIHAHGQLGEQGQQMST